MTRKAEPRAIRKNITLTEEMADFAEGRVAQIAEQQRKRANFSDYINSLIYREWKKAQAA